MPKVAVRIRSAVPARKTARKAAAVARKTAPRAADSVDVIAETVRLAQSVGGIKLNLPPRHRFRDDYDPGDEFQLPPRHQVRD